MSLVIYKKSKDSHHIYSEGRTCRGTLIVNEGFNKTVSNNYFIAGSVGSVSARTFLDSLNQSFCTIDDVFYRRQQPTDYFEPLPEELEDDDDRDDDDTLYINLPEILKFSSPSWMHQISKTTLEGLDWVDFRVIIAFRKSDVAYIIEADAETKSIEVIPLDEDFACIGAGSACAKGAYSAGVTNPEDIIKIVSTLDTSCNDKVFHRECARFNICLPKKKKKN